MDQTKHAPPIPTHVPTRIPLSLPPSLSHPPHLSLRRLAHKLGIRAHLLHFHSPLGIRSIRSDLRGIQLLLQRSQGGLVADGEAAISR
jgi:hypothetical protein